MSKKITREAVTNVSIQSLKKFENYPFEVREDEKMAELVSSIRKNGVISPLTVLPTEDGNYEILSGHRRKRACELAGINEVPIIIKHLNRDEAIIMMVDSNIQREEILPSEKARAYAMKYEALKRKEGRPSLNESNSTSPMTTRELIAMNAPEGARTIQRYIKLCNLIPELMKMVDNKNLGISSATELAFLSEEEQRTVLTSIETEGSPSLSQAQRIRRLSADKLLDEDSVFDIMKEQKKPDNYNVVIPMNKLLKYFPKAASPKEIEEKLLSLCERLYQQQQTKLKNKNQSR